MSSRMLMEHDKFHNKKQQVVSRKLKVLKQESMQMSLLLDPEIFKFYE